MKKKILSMALASVMALSSAAMVAAEENSPSVYVDDSIITFADQAAVIKDSRTLIPARGVFEAMRAKVEWDGETRTVTVTDKNNVIYITLTIDNPVMQVRTYSSLLNSDVKEVKLDVAPQILNDRTMIPLRAVGEALNAKVDWDQEAYRVDITTADKPSADADMPALSLLAPTTTVAAGENVDIYIALSNIRPDTWVSSVSAGVEYDKENFEFVTASLCHTDGTVIEGTLTETNTEFSASALKTISVTIDKENAAASDGNVMKLTFKSLTGKEGSFNLTNGYNTSVGVGYDTTLLLDKNDETASSMYNGNALKVDTTPVVISPADAAEVTDDTEATAEPEATDAPEATDEPEATAEPEATDAPDASAAPEATATPEA